MAKPDPTDLTELLQARKQRQRESSLKPNPQLTSQLPEEEIASSPRKVGRPPGRRSNPNVSPLNLLIDDDLVTEVRYKLRKLNKGKSLKKTVSDVVEELLQEWLEKY